ncbi:hypothetical protein ACJJTC_002891 [Scirpophaga incertulas]
MQENRYDEAAILCARICKTDKVLWENQIVKFAEVNQLRTIHKAFLKLVKEWNPELYKTGVIIKEVIEHLLTTEVDKNVYLEALALLYCYQKKYDKALTAYLKLQHKDVFKLITQHNMYNVIHDKILDLMTLDCDKALSVLLDKTVIAKQMHVPVEVVEEQLANNDIFLYKYLDGYSKIEPNGKYHGKLVKLYAIYAREKTATFS